MDLEEAIMLDYAFWKNLTTKLNKEKKDDDFCHVYNPVHVYCRMVDYYNVDKKDAFEYVKERYQSSYNNKCETGK